MPIIEICVVAFTIIQSVISTSKTFSEYMNHRDQKIRELVSLACDHTYITYIKKVKQGKLTDEQRIRAMELTKEYVKNKSPYTVSDHTLTVYINERLLFVKRCKRKLSDVITIPQSYSSQSGFRFSLSNQYDTDKQD